MRVHYILLLAASAFFASAEGNSVATDSAPGASTADRLAIAEKNTVSVSRSLRTAAGANGEGSIPRFAKIIKKYIAAYRMRPEEKLKLKNTEGYRSNSFFKQLKLNKKKNAGQLLDDPLFLKWLQYVKDTAETDPHGTAANTLVRYFPKVKDLYKVMVGWKVNKEDPLHSFIEELKRKLARKRFDIEFEKFDPELGMHKLALRVSHDWKNHPDQLFEAGRANLGEIQFAEALEKGLPYDPTNQLSNRLQSELFDSWHRKVIGPVNALNLLGRGVKVNDISKLHLNIWLRYVEYLLRKRHRKSLEESIITMVQNSQDDMLKALLNAVKTGGPAETGEKQLIKRWVQQKLHPEDVSWVLGAKALEEGSQEQKFLTAYKKAFNKEQENALIAANYHQSWIAALMQKRASLSATTPQ